MKTPIEDYEFRDTVNTQPDLQNPHDGEDSQQKTSISVDGIPENIDELVAEHMSGDSGRDKYNDTVNDQPRTDNPHDRPLEHDNRGLDQFSESEVEMLVHDAKTQDHMLDNSETMRCFRDACGLLDGKDYYMMLEVGSEINLVALSDGEEFRIDEAHDPDVETGYNPVVELIDQTAPDSVRKSLLNYEAVPDEQLNEEDYLDIEDADSLQALTEAPGTVYVGPGMQERV